MPYFKIIVPQEHRKISHASPGCDDPDEREEIKKQFSEHLPRMYFRGANSFTRIEHSPKFIQRNNGIVASEPTPNNYEVSSQMIDDHRGLENNKKLLSLTAAPGIAAYFASSKNRGGNGYVYCIQFEENAPNFYRSDVKFDSRLEGEMEVFGVNEIKLEQIPAYCLYNNHFGIMEIYLADDLSEEEQQKIICSMVSGYPTSDDAATNKKVNDLMLLKNPGHAFAPVPKQQQNIVANQPKAAAKLRSQPGANQQPKAAAKPQSQPVVSQQQKTVAKPQPQPVVSQQQKVVAKLQPKPIVNQQSKAVAKPQSAPIKQPPKKEKKSKLGLMALIGYGVLATVGVGLVVTGLGAFVGVPLITAVVIGGGTAVTGAALGVGGAMIAAKITEKPKPPTQTEIEEKAKTLEKESIDVGQQIYSIKEPKFDPTKRSAPSSGYNSNMSSSDPDTDLDSDLKIDSTQHKKFG